MLDTLFVMPQTWLLATIVIYVAASAIQRIAGGSALLNPLLLSICAVAVLLKVTQTPYERFRDAVAILDFLLGTAVVALGVPLYGLLRRFGVTVLVMLPALVTGSICGTELAIGLSRILDASPLAIATISPRTATAAIAAEISRLSGGIPSATAIACIASGILGAVIGPFALNAVGAKDPCARGIAFGTASHGIGTSQAFAESEETGAWSTLAMCLNGALTALLAPALLAAWHLNN